MNLYYNYYYFEKYKVRSSCLIDIIHRSRQSRCMSHVEALLNHTYNIANEN